MRDNDIGTTYITTIPSQPGWWVVQRVPGTLEEAVEEGLEEDLGYVAETCFERFPVIAWVVERCEGLEVSRPLVAASLDLERNYGLLGPDGRVYGWGQGPVKLEMYLRIEIEVALAKIKGSGG